MKAWFSEEYYRTNWDRFIERTVGEHWFDLEGSLKSYLEELQKNGMPGEAIPVVGRIKAQELAAECEKVCREDMATIKRVEAGTSGFGYTTKRQEHEARWRFRTRFEFNCFQLREFKKAHNL